MIAKKGADGADSLSQEAADLRYLQLSGGTLTGHLSVPDAAEASHAVNKGQLDTALKGTYTKDQCISAVTRAMMGLGSTATPDQALQKLAAGIGKFGFLIHLRLADGTPLPGATITGLTSMTGGTVVTDSNGNAFGISTSSPVSVSVTSIWIDVNNLSKIIYGAVNGLSEQTLTMTQKAVNSVLRIESSKTVRFVKAHYALVCCVQGGTGGNAGYGYMSTTSVAGGNGGAQGKIKNENVSLAAMTFYTAAIGSGGARGVGSVGFVSDTGHGSPGGETSFAGVSSADGTTSTLPLNDSTLNIGGKGGNGGSGNTHAKGGNGGAGTKAGGGGGGGQGFSGSAYAGGSGGSSPAGSAGSAPSDNSSAGGIGGNGGPGGGGGGGGGCRPGVSTSARGGNGGNGGPGIVLVKLLS